MKIGNDEEPETDETIVIDYEEYEVNRYIQDNQMPERHSGLSAWFYFALRERREDNVVFSSNMAP